MSTHDTARMTPAARRMAEKIPAELRAGTLEHWATSMSDDGRGTFIFGDAAHSFTVYSDGEYTAEPHTPTPTPPRTPRADLRGELEVIAAGELADVLADWDALTADQGARLAAYLRAELDAGGMLSADKFAEAGQMAEDRNACRRIIRQGRSMLAELDAAAAERAEHDDRAAFRRTDDDYAERIADAETAAAEITDDDAERAAENIADYADALTATDAARAEVRRLEGLTREGFYVAMQLDAARDAYAAAQAAEEAAHERVTRDRDLTPAETTAALHARIMRERAAAERTAMIARATDTVAAELATPAMAAAIDAAQDIADDTGALAGYGPRVVNFAGTDSAAKLGAAVDADYPEHVGRIGGATFRVVAVRTIPAEHPDAGAGQGRTREYDHVAEIVAPDGGRAIYGQNRAGAWHCFCN